MWIVAAYGSYLAVSVAVTLWVGKTLYRNGRVFLVDAFHGNGELAESVNHLLVAGFYLVNAGYVALALRTGDDVLTARAAIEAVCGKVGTVLLVLGTMHFLNLYVLSRLRKRGVARPPARPDGAGWGSEGTPMGRVLD